MQNARFKWSLMVDIIYIEVQFFCNCWQVWPYFPYVDILKIEITSTTIWALKSKVMEIEQTLPTLEAGRLGLIR